MSDGEFPESPLEFGIFDWIEYSDDEPVYETLEHRLRYVEAADRTGFYGWHIAEHQGTPISINSSSSVMLAAASQRTQRLRLAALNFILPWYNPWRFYNEICLLDQLSRGRLEVGVGRGVSPFESAFMGIDSVDEARERFNETLAIFETSATNEVLNYEGKYFKYHDLEVHNRPLQRPYPPLWYPSNERYSLQTIAPHGFNTVMNGSPEMVRALLEEYRELWLAHRDDPQRHNGHVQAPKLGKNHHIVVAETDAEAAKLGYEAYGVWRDRHSYLSRKNGGPQRRVLEPDLPESTAPMITGSPATVRERFEEIVTRSSINYLMLIFCFGNLKAEQTLRSIELFASEVMPSLRAAHASSRWTYRAAVS